MAKIAIIGGGAAGFFAANEINRQSPDFEISIFEKSDKLLSKVKVSGGGRCNVTNHCFEASTLSKGYPRGEKFLKKAFHSFQAKDTYQWFKERGVALVHEEDGRVFPKTNTSQTIVDCLQNFNAANRVKVLTKTSVTSLEQLENKWQITTENNTYNFDAVIVATGGFGRSASFLDSLDINTIPPLPSLFTFTVKDDRLKDLSGIAFKKVSCKITGSKTQQEGALLITHKGLSGPATLRLSAWGARELAEKEYRGDIMINFLPELSFEELQNQLKGKISSGEKKLVKNDNLFKLPERFWLRLLDYCDIDEQKRWIDLSKKQINKLANELSQGSYTMRGKNTFKEEFVTCGGVDLKEISSKTAMHQKYQQLYFAGEVLDIDGITGGFNFQAAWTTAWLAARNIIKTLT